MSSEDEHPPNAERGMRRGVITLPHSASRIHCLLHVRLELEPRPHLCPSRPEGARGLTEVRDVYASRRLLTATKGRHVVGVEHVEHLGCEANRPALSREERLPETKVDVAVPVLEVVVGTNGARARRTAAREEIIREIVV